VSVIVVPVTRYVDELGFRAQELLKAYQLRIKMLVSEELPLAIEFDRTVSLKIPFTQIE
jgi:hypothetical protein